MLYNLEFYILCINLNTVPSLFTNRQTSMAGMGASITIADAPIFTNIIETYMDYIGAGVI